tara:strand:+ start:41 stop:958 length:918 start_codon:yes stop_codon:yes gene_type:complete
MTTAIPEVDDRKIEYGVLIDLTLIVTNPTTGASGTGSTATITFAAEATAPFGVGDTITVSNMLPATYNGTFVVTAATTSSVSYASTATGSQTQAGIIGLTYYISNCYTAVSHNSKAYQALAGFLQVSEIQNNISNANDEVQVSLSAIPAVYIAAVLGTQIKGGEINIYRAFFDYDTQQVISGAVYKRFTGIVSNFSVQEDINTEGASPEVTHTITIIASSIMGVLENKVSGRRTNKQDFQIVYAELANSSTDPSMNRVEALFNSSFDFGKPYVAQAASTSKGNSGGAEAGAGGTVSENQTSGERF